MAPHFASDYRRDLADEIPRSQVPDGARLRHVTARDLDERIACRRASWLRSTWNEAAYRAVRASEVYDPELDIVFETRNGEFASYCICWLDQRTCIGTARTFMKVLDDSPTRRDDVALTRG